jgi:hypothetical protein
MVRTSKAKVFLRTNNRSAPRQGREGFAGNGNGGSSDPWQKRLLSQPACRIRCLTSSGWMKSLTEHLWFEVPDRRGFVNITNTIATLVKKSRVKEGLCLVNAMHITASVFINDNESGLLNDYEVWLEKLAPHEPPASINTTGPAKTTPMRI